MVVFKSPHRVSRDKAKGLKSLSLDDVAKGGHRTVPGVELGIISYIIVRDLSNSANCDYIS